MMIMFVTKKRKGVSSEVWQVLLANTIQTKNLEKKTIPEYKINSCTPQLEIITRKWVQLAFVYWSFLGYCNIFINY